jgi:hypothetical protein
MATFLLNAKRLLQYSDHHHRIAFDIGGHQVKPPASKTVEVKSLAELHAAIDAYALEVKATGLPWMISDLHKSGRKPNGYAGAEKALRRFVNEHLVPGDGAVDFDWSAENVAKLKAAAA